MNAFLVRRRPWRRAAERRRRKAGRKRGRSCRGPHARAWSAASNPSLHVPARLLSDAASLFRAFGEQYHERALEEKHVFPVVERKKSEAARYAAILKTQHDRGRQITDYLTSVTKPGRIATANQITSRRCPGGVRRDVPTPYRDRRHDRLSGLEGCASGQAIPGAVRAVRGAGTEDVRTRRLRGCGEASRRPRPPGSDERLAAG